MDKNKLIKRLEALKLELKKGIIKKLRLEHKLSQTIGRSEKAGVKKEIVLATQYNNEIRQKISNIQVLIYDQKNVCSLLFNEKTFLQS